MKLTELLFPPKCVGCHELLDWHLSKKGAFCAACQRRFESETLEQCGICAKAVKECLCVTKVMEKARCEALVKRVYYRHGMQTPVQNRLLFSMKRNRTPRIFADAAKGLAESVERLIATEALARESIVICHVPRRRSAYLEHGCDQAKLLALALARELSLPHQTLLSRSAGIKRERPQKQLPVKARIAVANTSYRCKKNAAIKGKSILLVDDLVTTGATMAACTRLLRRRGAAKVYCVALASDDYNRDAAGEG